MEKIISITDVCHVCLLANKPLKLCSKCMGVRYCSVECQRSDYKVHKLICFKKYSNINIKVEESVNSFFNQKILTILEAYAHYAIINGYEYGVCSIEENEKGYEAKLYLEKITPNPNADKLKIGMNNMLVLYYDRDTNNICTIITSHTFNSCIENYNKYKNIINFTNKVTIIVKDPTKSYRLDFLQDESWNLVCL